MEFSAGAVPWEACFRALNHIGHDGPISIVWRTRAWTGRTARQKG
ncbi:hypothetical protein [Nonomuraea sp. NPDC003201]